MWCGRAIEPHHCGKAPLYSPRGTAFGHREVLDCDQLIGMETGKGHAPFGVVHQGLLIKASFANP